MLACSHLVKLDFRGAYIVPPLECIRPLHRLKGLRELTLCNNDYGSMGEDADTSELDPQSLASLGCLFSLRRLTLTVGDVPTLLPYLTSLSELSDLDLTSHYTTMTGLSIAVPEFSHLGNLHHLTYLSWWGNDCSGGGMSFHQSTLPAICLCTQLTQLDLHNHIVMSTADIMALASMPLLKRLAVRQLRPEQHIVVPDCIWESLELRDFQFQDLARLPLAGIKMLRSKTWASSRLGTWGLGSCHSPDAVAAAAADVHAAALVLDHAFEAMYMTELSLKWFEVPSCPATAVIAGISPLRKHLTTLRLLNWRIDPQLVQQLAEVVPLLQHLVLVGCNISSDAWPAFSLLTSLCKLEFLSTLVSTQNVTYFAASAGSNVTISVDEASMQDTEFHDCERALEEARQALGLGWDCGIVSCVRICYRY